MRCFRQVVVPAFCHCCLIISALASQPLCASPFGAGHCKLYPCLFYGGCLFGQRTTNECTVLTGYS
ncbi:hypothetical protein OE88DRAFT_339367 [Heliocybe sulcata]|uniref:Secreted protein n=1 Tax=Heliocybe sulcata TaxID=5364 RepID=A0A5C3MZD9_9AGAM|nr:hypothetical protein OE88DRAFT_339367 [Heliocybe sulcata]